MKHGYVARAADWRFSSIHRYLRLCWVDAEWGCGDEFIGDFGEKA
jgi:putative transposase